MNWADYEFIAEEPPDRARRLPLLLTGWETIVFEIGDEDDEEIATFSPRPAAQRR